MYNYYGSINVPNQREINRISHISGYVWTISKRSQPHYIYITHIKVVIYEKEIPSIQYMQISGQYKKNHPYLTICVNIE